MDALNIKKKITILDPKQLKITNLTIKIFISLMSNTNQKSI